MSSLSTNPTDHRARLVADAVVSAYVAELSPPRRPVEPAARRVTPPRRPAWRARPAAAAAWAAVPCTSR
jgi:hypothetical protein